MSIFSSTPPKIEGYEFIPSTTSEKEHYEKIERKTATWNELLTLGPNFPLGYTCDCSLA